MSSLLSLLLLCLTMHACKARHLSVIDKELSKQVQLSVKEVEKERSVKTSIGSDHEVMISSKSDELQTGRAANGESIIIEGRGGASTQSQRPKHSGVGSRKVRKKMKKKTGKVTTVSSVESLVSVSWHVSHNKQKGHPGFNLDYAPPKTHPPSHN